MKMFILMLLVILYPDFVLASDNICFNTDISTIVISIGNIVNIIKIAAPVCLVIFGMIDFVKAIISSDDKLISGAKKSFVNRLIAGAIVFLVPTIVAFITGLFIDMNSDNNFLGCSNCLFNSKDCKGTVAVLKEKEKQEEEKRKEEQKKEEEKNENIISSPSITFSYQFNSNSSLRYALYTPSSAKSNSKTPLIIWLHGAGEKNASESAFKNSGLPKILNNWSLDGFNAYVLCPISSGSWSTHRTELYNLINKIVKEKNINTDKIILVGHSMGGIGVQSIANGNVDYFSALTILSGYSAGVDLNQFKNVPIRAYAGNVSYGEDGDSYSFTLGALKNAIGSDKVTILPTNHGNLPNAAFTQDKNKDNKSDLIEWMLSQ